MALNFKGETTTAVLNNTENVYKKDDLFRVYDAGILKLGNVVCEHGDFVSWNGTSWRLEKNAGYAVETNGAGDSLEERISAIELLIPSGTTENNKLVNESGVDEKLEMLEIAILSNSTLAANTFRFSFSKKDYDPTVAGAGSSGTWKKVKTIEANVWDWTKIGANFANVFSGAFSDRNNLVSVIATGDTSSVTNTSGMFYQCSALTSVPLFDTSNVTAMTYMFTSCTALKSVPLFDTSSVSGMSYMFTECVNVNGGALALYQQVSTQAAPPSTHTETFKNCGKNTTTGAEELAQIPATWGGTAVG